MAVKAFVEGNLEQKKCTSVDNLDVRGAFDAAWWPIILGNLKELKCPKNLYNMLRSYFSNRTALLRGNTIEIEKPFTMECPHGSCSGPGF